MTGPDPVTVDLASRVEGEGAPMLMMHGLFGNARNWHSVQRKVSASRQVHALDLRNHGASGWHDTMQYREMAADVLAYMDAQAMSDAIILGHSMGGKVAMTLALMAPQRVRAMVIVDIAPVRYETTLREFLNAMRALDLNQIDSRRDADNALSVSIPDTAVRGFLLQNLVSNDAAAGPRLRWRINLTAIDQAMSALGAFDEPGPPAQAQVGYPVAAIYGARSPYMNEAARQAMQAWFGQVRFLPIARAGHWVHAEQPSAFNEALQSFLDTV